MKLSRFIATKTKKIIAEWAAFADAHLPAARGMDLRQRCDHIAGMLKTIAVDLDTPQTKKTQASKSKGKNDALVDSATAANAHGTDRAESGFSPDDVVAEFRALRASVLRLWSESQDEFSHDDLDDVTRFNEAIDQLLAESMARYGKDVEYSKDLFLGVLGHDLRNPLGAIMMSATMMMTQDGPDSPHVRTASRILKASTRMDDLIGDLVDFTRTRLGSGIPIVPVDTDMETLCRDTVDELRAFHPHKVIHFAASGKLRGEWDGRRIAQALSNLCGNALQHGSDAPIDVGLRGDASAVIITVHNVGRRIPKRQLANIFDPFKQLDSGTAKPGAARSVGLGLYIVRAIVTAHQGTIEVDSTDGGTTFTMTLPRKPAVEDR